MSRIWKMMAGAGLLGLLLLAAGCDNQGGGSGSSEPPPPPQGTNIPGAATGGAPGTNVPAAK